MADKPPLTERSLDDEPKFSDKHVILNQSHAEYLLRGIGLLEKNEALHTSLDPVKLEKIKKRFKVISDPQEPEKMAIDLSGAEIERVLTTVPSTEDKSELVTQSQVKDMLIQAVCVQIKQINLAMFKFRFDIYVEMNPMTELQIADFRERVSAFPRQCKAASSYQTMLIEMVELVKDQPLNKVGLNNLREVIHVYQKMIDANDLFLQDKAKIATIRAKAESVGITLPPIFPV